MIGMNDVRFTMLWGLCGLLGLLGAHAQAEEPAGEGNRYSLERQYHSEISAAKAYINVLGVRGQDRGMPGSGAVIIDVRSIPEYRAGHPEKALNIPYPRIWRGPCERYADGKCSETQDAHAIMQDESDFLAAVRAAVPDRSTPIYTMCRTGYRSVLAANILTEAGYTRVRNLWEGFVGRYKLDHEGNKPLDLNKDGEIGAEDKDGWRYYQDLPWTTRLQPQRLYQRYQNLYYR